MVVIPVAKYHRCYDRYVTPMPPVRERTEELERASLSTWATLAADTKGRDRHEEPDPLRTVFQVDRDRILSSAAFRRLSETALVSLGEGEPPTSALHRTLRVTAVARTIARGLRLNEDLTEAIALGQELGLPPFGSAGEDALSTFTETPFRHAEQGVRVVERLTDGGLNLTWEVRDGILHHDATAPQPATPEAQVVRMADTIAAVVYVLDDAVRGGLVSAADIPLEAQAGLGTSREERLSRMVSDVIVSSADRPEIAMGTRVSDATAVLQAFVDELVHHSRSLLAERDRALHCLRTLSVYYLEAGDHLPRGDELEPPVARVCDYLCSLTDTAAVAEFRRLFEPRV
jgi:dGTPase